MERFRIRVAKIRLETMFFIVMSHRDEPSARRTSVPPSIGPQVVVSCIVSIYQYTSQNAEYLVHHSSLRLVLIIGVRSRHSTIQESLVLHCRVGGMVTSTAIFLTTVPSRIWRPVDRMSA